MKQAKKILAIFLSVLMLLSVMSVGISATADAPIVIDDASDWDAYKQADGSYLLPKDGKFTVSAQLETLSGNFNGNGSTITTSVPLFYNVSGVTVENLTLEGNITAKAREMAAVLSEYTTNFATIKNVVNNANVSLANFEFDNPEGMGAAGLVGSTSGGTTTMENCINNGTITVHGKNVYASGILGKVRNGFATLINCVNNGNITATSDYDDNVGAGGVIGYIYGGKSTVTITGCGNTGTISSKYLAAGIVARNYSRPNAISACYNTGSVSATGTAGIAGGIDATGTNASLNYCWNKGEVTAAVYAAQISAYGASSEMLNNYYLDTVTAKAYAFVATDPTNEGAVAFTAAELASGKLAYDINTAAEAQVFFQNISATNSIPTSNPADGNVLKIGEDYLNLSIITRDAASARIEEGNAGLRFATDIKKADYDALVASGIAADTIKVGTIITPYEKIEDIEFLGEVFTVDKLEEGDYYDIPATLKTEGTDCYFRNSIVNISKADYDTDYAAIGYIQFGETIIYSANYTIRNVEQVATAAYADRADASADGYANSISASSAVAIDSKATYSPYTEAQLTILKAYIAE